MPAVITKHAIISRSGVYNYHRSEVPRFNIGAIPDSHKNRTVFQVYRPSSVIADSVKQLTKLPITVEHHGVRIDGVNFRDHTVGWTGDNAQVVPIENSKEVGVSTELNIVDEEAKSYYSKGFREVSPNYDGVWRWCDGVSPDGAEYQIIMDKVTAADSLAMTRKGRGGNLVAIQDSEWSEGMKTGLWRWLKNKFKPVSDSHIEFKAQLIELVEKRNEWTPAMVSDAVEKLRNFCDDLPVSEDKEVLCRFISDLWDLNNVLNTDEMVKEAAEQIYSLYEKLDKDATEEVDMLFGKKKETPVGDADPVKPEAEAPPPAAEPPAPAAPAEPAPDAPVAAETPAAPAAPAAEMSLANIPEDMKMWSDDVIAFILLKALQFLKSQETVAAPAQEAAPAVPEAAAPEAPPAEPASSEPPKKEPTGDSSPFGQSLSNPGQKSGGISEYSKTLMSKDKRKVS